MRTNLAGTGVPWLSIIVIIPGYIRLMPRVQVTVSDSAASDQWSPDAQVQPDSTQHIRLSTSHRLSHGNHILRDTCTYIQTDPMIFDITTLA